VVVAYVLQGCSDAVYEVSATDCGIHRPQFYSIRLSSAGDLQGADIGSHDGLIDVMNQIDHLTGR
jgi:hypothetical protein